MGHFRGKKGKTIQLETLMIQIMKGNSIAYPNFLHFVLIKRID